MSEPKSLVVRDAAHDYIVFSTDEAELVRRLLQCREVQRLRRIKQLGFSYITYPGAEHTRFQHSLGAAFIGSRLCAQLPQVGVKLEESQRLAMVAAALLHDVGHLPFSHATEAAVSARGDAMKHEEKSVALIREETEIHDALAATDPSLPDLVAHLISGGSPGYEEQVLHGFMEGNLDVDRLDFVLRDSVHTGVRSGMVDLHRLLTGFVLHNSTPLFELKNLATVEEFLLARAMMYEKVYFHKTTRGLEVVYRALFARLGKLMDEGTLPEHIARQSLCQLLARGTLDYDEFVLLDDADVIVLLKAASICEDTVVNDLARRVLWRRPLKAVTDGTDVPSNLAGHNAAMNYLRDNNFEPDYYYHWDSPSDLPYKQTVTAEDGEGKPALEVLVDGKPEDICLHSTIAHALIQRRKHVRVYAPEECRHQVAKLLSVSDS